MDRTSAASRPRVRLTTVAATIALAAAAGRIAIEVKRRLTAAAERHDRAARELTRTVGQLSMIDRRDDELEAATLMETRQIRHFMSRVTEELRVNNERWGRRREEAYADGYLAGAHAARRDPVPRRDPSAPTVVRRRPRRRPPRPSV